MSLDMVQTRGKKPAGFLKNARFFLLFVLGVVLVLLILLVKSFSFDSANPLFSIYAFGVIIFIFSRVTASFFYHIDKKHGEKWVQKIDYFPSVSFVIPVKNEEAVIFNTIERCFKADYPKRKIQVIIINDGSTDSTLNEIKRAKKIYSRLTIIDWSINRGKRDAMAAGIRWARGEIIVQLDSDSWLDENSLKILVNHFKDPLMGGVVAHTDPSNKDDSYLTKMQAAYYLVAFKVHKAAESVFDVVFCCSGCCSAYRREYLLPVLDGWLNETHLGVRTTYGDDRGLTNLMIMNGYKTIYDDRAQAYTVVPTKIKQFAKQQIRWKKGWAINTVRIAKFITKKDPLVAFTYIYPQIFLSFTTPFIILYTMMYYPLLRQQFSWFYFLGLLLVYAFFIICYAGHRKDKYGKYLFLWGITSALLSSFLFPYAMLTLRDTKWGTR